jgi:phosphate:Na+ symporter
MLAGVAFFMLAMNFMEDVLRQLAGRPFKVFLKKQTASKIKAIGGGAVVTALLQSSSIVNLLVLSMVGAGVVKMENALAIMLGSNLGTTFNNWIIATLGFNYNIDTLALPIAGITGITMAFLGTGSRLFLWCKFLFSLAFLFIALGFIKTGMEAFVKGTDLSAFVEYPVIIFLLLGVFLTAIIQSSSATIALTLSALYADAITLYIATAIALGSEIGTTFKLFLASAKGQAVKKRVALGNFLFNTITVVLLFIFLGPVNYLITDIFNIRNNLVALVFFQSFVNISSIILFFPFLKKMSSFLLQRFRDAEDESFYISKVPLADTELAIEALERETSQLIHYVVEYNVDSFGIKALITEGPPGHKTFNKKSLSEKYDYIKQLHGEIHHFCLRLLNATPGKKEIERVEQLISATRNLMYAAKNIGDAQHDISQMRDSANDIKYNFYTQAQNKIEVFYKQVLGMLDNNTQGGQFEELSSIYKATTSGYAETMQSLYKESVANRVSELEISTLINFNRELYTSFKSILFGLKDYFLSTGEAEYFDSLPGFIR